MADHPCCRVHLLSALPPDLQDVVGAYVGREEMQRRAPTETEIARVEHRAESKCSNRYERCKDIHRAAEDKQFADACTERCNVRCVEILQRFFSRPSIYMFARGPAWMAFTVEVAPSSPLKAALGVSRFEMHLTYEPKLKQWATRLHIVAPESDLKTIFPHAQLRSFLAQESPTTLVEQQDSATTLCAILFTHVARLRIDGINGRMISSGLAHQMDALFALVSTLRSILGPDLEIWTRFRGTLSPSTKRKVDDARILHGPADPFL